MLKRFAAILLSAVALAAPAEVEPLRLVVIGVEHGHVGGALWNAANRDDIDLVGVYSPNRGHVMRLAIEYGFDQDLYFDDMDTMLESTNPEAASVMTSTARHVDAVAACARHGVHAMVEKPLDFDYERAKAMVQLADAEGILLLTNYETSWYKSVRTAHQMVVNEGTGPLRRAVFRHGHSGPIEIGCSREFLAWLLDEEQNGGGAITDFGCYGAVIMTWLMNGQRPTSVSATTQHLKGPPYEDIDDDATIVLTYPDATAVIQASWAWTHDTKEMDLHTEKGSLHAGKWDDLSFRFPDQEAEPVTQLEDNAGMENEWTYLRRVVRGEVRVDPLSAPELNLVAVKILDAARESARTGRAVAMK